MPYNILLADDDKDFRDEFKDCFEDYEIVEASNGNEALAILKKPNEIDLVILDVIMPGLKGTEILKQIKKSYPDMGIVILTGYSSKDVAVEALKARADDYIEKPININKTKEIIERLLDKKNGEDINIGGIKGIIERVKKFAERNYHKKVCLKDAASAVFLSPKYLSRVFKQNTSMGFSEYKLGIKIAKAKELLQNTEYNIEQISDKTGYENIESFTRIFKKMTGYTPTEYRENARSKKSKKIIVKQELKSGKKLQKKAGLQLTR